MTKTTRRKRKLHLVLLPLLLLAVVAGVFLLLRFRNGKEVHSTQDIRADAAAVLYRQDDVRWSEDKLGDSGYTLKSSGCLVSCIASAFSMEGKTGVTPGTLNQAILQAQGYDEDGNLLWDKLNGLEGCSVKVYSEVSSELLEDCLMAGNYPIVRVRMHGIGNFHYVLITGAERGTFTCMDPLQDEIQDLTKYGNRVYAVRCIIFK